METKRIDGKPECFGKQVDDSSHCRYCKLISECVDELIGVPTEPKKTYAWQGVNHENTD